MTEQGRPRSSGFTLVELLVALALFAVVMTIASGSYLIMINATRNAQAISTGINNFSFALDSMTRAINTGSDYTCVSSDQFRFTDQYNDSITYSLASVSGGYRLQQSINGASAIDVTDPTVVITSNDVFYCSGTAEFDNEQAHVTMVLQGTVDAGHGKTESFYVQTGSTMRGTDL